MSSFSFKPFTAGYTLINPKTTGYFKILREKNEEDIENLKTIDLFIDRYILSLKIKKLREDFTSN